jgi:uncharacterized protein (TIGR02145 family)
MKHNFVIFALSILSYSSFAQGVKIGSPGIPNASSVLELESNSKGFLPPRMTTSERDAISVGTAESGLQIFNTTTNCLQIFIPPIWQNIYCGCNEPAAPAEGVHASSKNQIQWNWTSVPEATGYRYNTSNDFASATPIATTSYTQTGLTCGTPYTFFVWSVSNCGYSSAITMTASTSSCFDCGTSTVTDLDGNIYTTVLIGTQCWFTENLKVTQYNNAAAIPNVTGASAWAALSTGAWSYYNNNSSYDAAYGKLYNWFAVDNGGLCPSGSHVPTDAEWTVLTTYLGGESIAGGSMKSLSGWNAPNTGATNSSGFGGVGAGLHHDSGAFYALGEQGIFWSSTEYTPASTVAWMRLLSHNDAIASPNAYGKINGYSVRCLIN